MTDSASPPNQPHVVMVISADFFSRDWAGAAEFAARVTRLVPVRRLSAPALGDRAWLGRTVSGTTVAYEVAMLGWRPARLLGRIAQLVNDRRVRLAMVEIGRRDGQVDLTHAHFYSNARSLLGARRRLGIPYVLTEHSSSLMERPRRTGSGPLRRARRACRSAAVVTVVSEALGRSMAGQALPGPHVQVPNPIDVDRFALPRPPRAAGPFRLLAVGSLLPGKGYDVLLAAVARLRADGCPVTLDIVGGGRQEELKRVRDRIGLGDVVRFTGALDRSTVAEALATHDVFVSASRMETFGVAIAEALCAGVPVVATRVGGVPEVVRDGWGVLVPPDDSAALAAGLADVIAGLDGYDSEAIAAAARARFSYSSVGARLAAVYRMALDPPDANS